MRGLELAHLFHECFILVEEAVALPALGIDLLLPAGAHRGLFLLRTLTAKDPACDHTDDCGGDHEGDVNSA